VKLVVGLGNPGGRYAGTRHNLGFDVVDVLAARHRIDLATEKFHGWFGTGDIGNDRVVLLKPTTFMNRSGNAVLSAVQFYKLDPADLMVIADDLAMPPGRLRMRMKGSSGNHNGLQDIIDRLGTEEWSRLRIGIGPATGDPSAYVLARFDPPEEPVMRAARERAADAVECWIGEGVERAMNRFNVDAGKIAQGEDPARET
jgi:PTH1 family peptidyl-tRNA hydrolase